MTPLTPAAFVVIAALVMLVFVLALVIVMRD